MKLNSIFTYLFLLGLFSLPFHSCDNGNSQVNETQMPTMEETIEYGSYLVTIMGCNDCHTPKRLGPNGPELIPELLLSGFPSDRPLVNFTDPLLKEGFGMFYPDLTAAVGPWGVSFAANLTPDDTGIGSWSEEQWIRAFKHGKLKGLENGRMLLPPMPTENYKVIKDEDALAIFHYLKSVDPVSNVVPAALPPNEM